MNSGLSVAARPFIHLVAVGFALLLAWVGGCTFDRSGLADKVECFGDSDCRAGRVCVGGRCTVAADGSTGDAADMGGGDLDGGDAACPGAPNACGGCGPLDHEPGEPCGECDASSWVCSPDGSRVLCVGEGALNACGGCGALDGEPNASCGECGGGTWTCTADRTAVICEGAAAPNACGGCGALSGTPDVACGACGDGIWTCDADGSAVTCVGATAANACGGCGSLDHEPGEACGPCDLDHFVCVGGEATACDGTTAVNACGGCTVLEDPPSSPCGPCGLDAFVCGPDGETTACGGETYGNGCGGCDALAGEPGDVCSCEGLGDAIWACDGTEAIACDDADGSAGLAIDLGDGDERARFDAVGWMDSADDLDWYAARAVDDRADSTIRPWALLIRADDDFSSDTSPVEYDVCVFYRYDDARGSDLGNYSCGYSDRGAVYDASQNCVSPHCPTTEPLDPEVDLFGCCEWDYLGYTDSNGRTFRGWVVEIQALDQNSPTNVDDRGEAFLYVGTVSSPAEDGCDEYRVSLFF